MEFPSSKILAEAIFYALGFRPLDKSYESPGILSDPPFDSYSIYYGRHPHAEGLSQLSISVEQISGSSRVDVWRSLDAGNVSIEAKRWGDIPESGLFLQRALEMEGKHFHLDAVFPDGSPVGSLPKEVALKASSGEVTGWKFQILLGDLKEGYPPRITTLEGMSPPAHQRVRGDLRATRLRRGRDGRCYFWLTQRVNVPPLIVSPTLGPRLLGKTRTVRDEKFYKIFVPTKCFDQKKALLMVGRSLGVEGELAHPMLSGLRHFTKRAISIAGCLLLASIAVYTILNDAECRFS